MIIVGFVLLAAAAVIAVALVVQNPATVTVHAFKWSWDVDMRWLFVAGLALTAIGLLGLAMMRVGSAHYLRLRRDRKLLAAENQRLIERAGASNARRAPAEPRVAPPMQPVGPMPAAPMAAGPMPPAPMERPPAARPAPPAPPATSAMAGPTAPATGSVAAPERIATTSTHPHGIRERLTATRHRHEKE